jgi:hypothetical protein
MMLLTETRERFVLAIASQVPAERIAEIHFFQPIRQGGVESGVAVVAAWPEPAARVPSDEPPQESSDEGPDESDRHEEREPRPVVYTARYRLTLKGLDRGKWETSVVAEADAPLITVDAVVRGVQRRSGDADGATRMEGDDVRAILEAKRASEPAR